MGRDLPDVDIRFPWPVRVAMIALGLIVIGLPISELARTLWPPNILSLLAGMIILGAGVIGMLLVLAGIFGKAQRWRYPPRTVLVDLSGWRSQRQIRLTAREIAAVKVKQHTHSEGPDTWRVELVRVDNASDVYAGWGSPLRRSRFETADFPNKEKAEAARAALAKHLQL